MLSSMSAEPPDEPAARRIWILGAGKFGRIAAERLGRRRPDAQFLVIDGRKDRTERIAGELGLPVCTEDAISFLEKNALPDDVWLIPAVPVHVAFLWLFGRLRKIGFARALPVPESVDAQVPNPYRGLSGTLYSSYADFMCPDACSEPDSICTYTKKPRLGNLFEQLERLEVPGFEVLVVRSSQLAPGVGGYPVARLMAAFDAVSRKPGSWLVSTSCRCHGVTDAVKWD